MKTMKMPMILLFLLFCLCGGAGAQMNSELKVPMQNGQQYYAPSVQYQSSSQAPAVQGGNAAFRTRSGAAPAVSAVPSLATTTYDDNGSSTRVKRRSGSYNSDDEDDDAGGDGGTPEEGIAEGGLPIGNGFWLLMAAAMGYCVYILRRMRKEDERTEADDK